MNVHNNHVNIYKLPLADDAIPTHPEIRHSHRNYDTLCSYGVSPFCGLREGTQRAECLWMLNPFLAQVSRILKRIKKNLGPYRYLTSKKLVRKILKDQTWQSRQSKFTKPPPQTSVCGRRRATSGLAS